MKWQKESEYAKGATSPKIYDLRTPQKKSGTKKTYSSEFSDKTYSSDSSDTMFDPTDDYKSTGHTKPTNNDSKPTNTISSSNWVSIVDKILMEKSSCAKKVFSIQMMTKQEIYYKHGIPENDPCYRKVILQYTSKINIL